jgi:hypothetical protein
MRAERDCHLPGIHRCTGGYWGTRVHFAELGCFAGDRWLGAPGGAGRRYAHGVGWPVCGVCSPGMRRELSQRESKQRTGAAGSMTGGSCADSVKNGLLGCARRLPACGPIRRPCRLGLECGLFYGGGPWHRVRQNALRRIEIGPIPSKVGAEFCGLCSVCAGTDGTASERAPSDRVTARHRRGSTRNRTTASTFGPACVGGSALANSQVMSRSAVEGLSSLTSSTTISCA